MKKWSMIVGAVVLAGGVLAACSETTTEEQETNKPEETAQEGEQGAGGQPDQKEGTETPAEKETPVSKDTTSNPTTETAKESDPKETPADIIETKGVFNGIADPHTVEIEVDGQPQAFQVAPGSETMKQFEQLKEGTEITFTYKKDGEQLIIQELKTEQAVETKGVFNGIADPHTVEIEVDGQPQAFQVAPGSETMKQFEQLEEGTEITFTYKKDGEQLIIQELKTEQAVETKGVFNGIADPHTVEVEVDGQPQAFQVAPDSEIMKQFEQLEEGTEITFTYIKEGEQLIIQELK
ncbi:hypothetical protein QYG89_14130 [Bacillus sp. B190/17]|uniref:Lipoprotein n=1 Tax=Bacillus lumedeiriae TaxID=3058829 RepID=A0ABW8IC93_9BACI